MDDRHGKEKPDELENLPADEKVVDSANKQRADMEDMASDPALTRKIVLKLDYRILPVFILFFFCSFLDRTNVGNAKTYKLEADLKMTDHQYDIGLAIYYVTYIASEIPSNLVLKKVSPKIWLPALTVIWGIVTMCLGFVRNYAGFIVVRAILGLAEGGLLPGMVLYLSGIYVRGEMALRLGLFYIGAPLSGAVGGLLARGLTSIGQRGDQAKWSWIFIIEGLLTIVIGTASYFVLPNGVDTASFLTPNERIHARNRLRLDMPTRHAQDDSEDIYEAFTWSEVIRGLTSPSTWLSASAYCGILVGLYSFGLFLPTIIVELGYTANQAQLWSVIPYAVASVITVIIAIISDRLKVRGIIILFVLIPAIIGYAVIANISDAHPKVKYGMTFLMSTGLYASVPCMLGWNSNNSAGHYKRATTAALQLSIANSGGFIATFSYPDKDKPRFHNGHTVVLGLLVFAWFMVALNVLYCWKVNRDKINGKYDKFIGFADDRDPNFVMIL